MTDDREPSMRKPASNGRAVAAVIAVVVAAGIAGALILSDSGTPKHATVELDAPAPSVPAPPPLVIDEHPAKEIVPSIEEQPELMTEQPDVPAKLHPADKGARQKRP